MLSIRAFGRHGLLVNIISIGADPEDMPHFVGISSRSTLLMSYYCDGRHKCGILSSVDSDEPVQPPFFKLRNSK